MWRDNIGPVHSAYNPSFSACFSSRNSIFFLTTNQPIVFFSRLISTAERLHYLVAPAALARPNESNPQKKHLKAIIIEILNKKLKIKIFMSE
jgi:hypothetical protein